MSAGNLGSVVIDLTADLSQYSGKLSEARRDAAQLIRDIEGKRPHLDIDISAAEHELQRLEQDAQGAGKSLNTIGAGAATGSKAASTAISGIGATAAKTESQVSNASAGMQRSLTGFAGSISPIPLGYAAAGAAAGVFAAQSLAAFASFDQGIRQVFTLIPNASAQMRDQLTSDVKSIATQYGFLTDDVLQGLYQALSAGVPPENVVQFLQDSAPTAIAGATSLTDAVNVLTNTTNAYGQANLSAAKASDILLTGVRIGKTTLGELNASLSNVVPTAKSASVGLDQVVAALATMTSQGEQTGKASTDLRQLLVELADSGTGAGKVFRDVAGTDFTTFIQQGHSIQDALNLMQTAADNSGVSLAQMFSSVEAGQGALELTGTSAKTLATNLDATKNSYGATAVASKEMTDGVSHDLKQLSADLDVLKIEIGQGVAPVVHSLVDEITTLAAAVDHAKTVIADAKDTSKPASTAAPEVHNAGDLANRWTFDIVRALSLTNDAIDFTGHTIAGFTGFEGGLADSAKTAAEALAEQTAAQYALNAAYTTGDMRDKGQRVDAGNKARDVALSEAQAAAYALGDAYSTAIAGVTPSIDTLVANLLRASGPAGLGTVFQAIERGSLSGEQAITALTSTGTVSYRQFRQAGETELARLRQALVTATDPAEVQKLRVDILGVVEALNAGTGSAAQFGQSSAQFAAVNSSLRQVLNTLGPAGLETVFKAVESGSLDATHAVSLLTSSGTVSFHQFVTAAGTELQSLHQQLADALATGDAQGALQAQSQIDALSEAMLRATANAGQFTVSMDPVIEAYDHFGAAIDEADRRMQDGQKHTDQATKAQDLLKQEYDAGRISAEDYQKQLGLLTWYHDRSKNGILDEADAYVKGVEKQADYTRQLDDINAKYPEAQRNSKAYRDEVANLNAQYDPAIASQQSFQDGLKSTADAMGKTVGQIVELLVKLGLLSRSDANVILGVTDNATQPVSDVQKRVDGYKDNGPYSATVGADTSPFDNAMGGVSGSLSALTGGGGGTGHEASFEAAGRSSKTYSVTIDADTTTAETNISILQGDLGALPSDFYITAHVDTGQAEAQINALNQLLPHSPAERGPFRTLPNWQALFDIGPAAAAGVDMVVKAGTEITDTLSGVAGAAGNAGVGAAGAWLAPFATLPDDVQQLFTTHPIDWSWLFAGIDLSADDAGKRMGEAIAKWFTDLDKLASGDTLKAAQDALSRLFDVRQVLVETNAGADAIAELDKEIHDQQANIAAIGTVMGTTVVAKLKESLNAKAVLDEFIQNVQSSLGGLDFSNLDYAKPITLDTVTAGIKEQIAQLTVLRDAAAKLGYGDAVKQYDAQLADLNAQAAITAKVFGTDVVQAYIREQQALAQTQAAAQAAADAHQHLIDTGVSLVTALGVGGDAAAQYVTGIMTAYQNAQAALATAQTLNLSPEVTKQLQQQFDDAQKIFAQGMGTLRIMLQAGLIDDKTLQALVKQGGKAFEAWYDSIFGPGAIAKVEAGWKLLLDPATVADLFSNLTKVSDDSLKDLVTSITNGALSIDQAFHLISTASGGTSIEMKQQLLDFLDTTWAQYQQALLTGNQDAAKSFLDTYTGIEALLIAFASANGETVDQLIADWQRAIDAADKASKQTQQASQSVASTTTSFNTPIFDPSGNLVGFGQAPAAGGQPAAAPTPSVPAPPDLSQTLQLYQELAAIANTPGFDSQEVADRIVADVDVVISAFDTAAQRWKDKGLAAIQDYLGTAGQGFQLLQQSNDAIKGIADGSRLSANQLAVYKANTEDAFVLIDELATEARQYETSAADLARIVANMNASLNSTTALLSAIPAGSFAVDAAVSASSMSSISFSDANIAALVAGTERGTASGSERGIVKAAPTLAKAVQDGLMSFVRTG